MRQSSYFAPWGYVRQAALGEDAEAPPPVSPDALVLLREQRADLVALRATMEKDLFWRRVGVFVAVAGVTVGLARLADILIAIRRRRAEGE